VIDHFLYSLRALAPEAFRDLREMLGDINPADKELNRATDALLVARVFGDLTLFESLCIAVQLKKTIDAFVVRAADSSRPPRTAQIILQHLPLTHYDMTLCLVSADGPHPREETALSALEDFARQHDRTGARPWGPALVVFVKEQGASFIHAIPIVLSQILPSATELFLDRVRSEQYA
ncbi:MAG TPA: hypothetical protein VFL91_10800, partial [Thermomicrobiales bacterium]|nr:hypothetical protein [Thermomicrobiales bacterium]